MFAPSRFSVRRLRWACACLSAIALMALSARLGGAAQRPAAAPAPAYKTIFEKNVAVPMRDGAILRANIYRPDAGATKFPVILTIATYGKDYDMTGGRLPYWEDIHINFPEVCENSTCREIVYETVDPERWVQKGYVLVRVDSRGTGRSPGVVEAFGLQETFDFYDAIEWAATQPWSTGKIGTAGISYYAWKIWQVAALNPPHLAAAVNWEGSSDFYREVAYHGGIRNSGGELIYAQPSMNNQHGLERSPRPDMHTGMTTGPDRPTGPEVLTGYQLLANRFDLAAAFRANPLENWVYKTRKPNLANIKVPMLVAGNWGGHGLHLRGATEGFTKLGTPPEHKWLEMHTGTHWQAFYVNWGVAMQMKFFDYYLKGVQNGWDKEPHVQVQVRGPSGVGPNMPHRAENEYPLARTKYTKFYLDATGRSIGAENPAATSNITYAALSSGVQFLTAPFAEDTEFLGPVSLKLWVSSSTTDADLFVTLRALDPSGTEITFNGANDPKDPMTVGWLRVSHRKLDPALSTPSRPYHTHDEVQKISPGQVYPVEVEVWPTSMVFPKGYRLAVVVQGQDYVNSITYTHNDPNDRPAAEFAGVNTLHTGGSNESYLLMPVIPAK